MKSYRKELWFDIPQRMAFVNITSDVGGCLKESGIRDGMCLVKTKYSVFLLELFLLNWTVKFARALPHENSMLRLEIIPLLSSPRRASVAVRRIPRKIFAPTDQNPTSH